MSTKSRKRMQRKKAKNRTGLIKSLTGYHSSNQHDKRTQSAEEYTRDMENLQRKMGLL